MVKVLAKARASYEGLAGEAWLPRSLLAGRVHFFEGCWADGLNSLVTVAWTSPPVSCHEVISSEQAYKSQSENASKRVMTFSFLVMTFCNLISVVESHHICHILFIKKKGLECPGGRVVKDPPLMRGHGFPPCSRKIPYAAGQLSPCSTTTES